jgi:hypothetical protein
MDTIKAYNDLQRYGEPILAMNFATCTHTNLAMQGQGSRAKGAKIFPKATKAMEANEVEQVEAPKAEVVLP